MAIEYVGGNSNSGATNTTVSVSLTNLTGGLSSSAAEGDIVIVCTSNTDYSTPSVSTSGYSNFYSALSRGATYPNNMISSYKIMGSTPDTTVSCVFSSGLSVKAAAVAVYVWRGVDKTTPIDVTPQTTTGIASTGTNIVPPAITPVTTGALVVITAGLSCQNSSTPNLNDPTGYSNLVRLNGFASNGNAGVLISSKVWGGSGAETPGIVDRSPSSTANAFCASTIALRPASTSTNFQINIGDSWKTVESIQINIGDSWKEVTNAQINIGDTWKTIY
jgi:hypothetical protein